MIRLSYASTKNKDQMYKVRVNIGDDFFLLEIDEKTNNKANNKAHSRAYIFLDHREFDVFKEKNKNPRIGVVALEPILKKIKQKKDGGKNGKQAGVGMASKIALQILQDYNVEKETIEVPAYFPLDMADYLRSKKIQLKIIKPFYPERQIKEAWEVELIEQGIKKTHRAYAKIEEILKDSVIKSGGAESSKNTHKNADLIYKGVPLTSKLMKKEVEKVLIGEGMLNVEGIIISCGKDAAIPHHPGGGTIKSNQTIICDLFPVSQDSGYFSDMTRTYVKGIPTPMAQKMYDAVLLAQETALKMARPGIKASDIHEAVCRVFFESGFHVGEKGFTHSTGHGLGLDIHELPNISKSSEVTLAPGHVFTVEPGLYYPEYGGVRIEDVICITKDGCKNLINYPKKFVIL